MEQKCRVVYIVSDELAKISSLLPSNRNRSILVHSLAKAMSVLSQDFPAPNKTIQLLKPTRASYQDLSVYHSRDYLDFVLGAGYCTRTGGNNDFGLEDDCPPFNGLSQYVQLVAGASLAAANTLVRDKADVAICWDGGRHHAQKSRASGFCYIADCILVILCLRRPLASPFIAPPAMKPRVMYLDLDLHFSDAVSHAFYSPNTPAPSQVLTFSIHYSAPGFFPPSSLSGLPDVKSPSFDPLTLSMPLKAGASDSTFARIWPIVERVKDTFEPNYIVVQCGTDGLCGDPHMIWNWSLGEREGSFGWCVGRIINHWAGKKLLLGGGGYNNPNVARAWTYLTSVTLGKPLALDSEIPDHPAFPLYAPSFTLDVPGGNMQDQNSEEYLKIVETSFENVIVRLKQKLSCPIPCGNLT